MQFEQGDSVDSTCTPALATTLADLPQLAVAHVLDVCADGDDSARLKAMGICAGRQIQLVQTGDPLIVRVVGIRIGLSQRLAERVLIQNVDWTPSEVKRAAYG